MPQVFITDAQERKALAVVRSLGKKGITVTAGEETRFATTFFSKYCKNHVVYPSPKKKPSEFRKYMLNQVKRKEFDLLLPLDDEAIIEIVKNKKEFSKHTVVPYPKYGKLMKAMDKEQTVRIAMENNICCPETYFVNKIAELEDMKAGLPYPVVIKPRRSYGARGITLCKSEEELISKYEKVYREFGPALIQEYIPSGGEIGVYTLFNFDSEPRALTVQKRIRSYPVSGGPSTLRETVKRPELVETAFELLKALDWQGLAMVEFRIDSRDHKPKLMEINPRFWGSLQLSILAGVDFPYLLYKMAIGGDVEPALNYKEGVRCRWLLPGDILHFLSAPSKVKNIPEFLKFGNTNYDILSCEDPGPTLGFMLATLRYLFNREMWKFVIRSPLK